MSASRKQIVGQLVSATPTFRATRGPDLRGSRTTVGCNAWRQASLAVVSAEWSSTTTTSIAGLTLVSASSTWPSVVEASRAGITTLIEAVAATTPAAAPA